VAAAESIKAGINQFLDNYSEPTKQALAEHLLTEADLDRSLRGVFRVMIHLGLLDPPELVAYSKIGVGADADPWNSPEHKALARRATQESIVLLKNEKQALPLDREKLKSIAVIGPHANEVLLDWYSGTPPYVVTPLQGITDAVGPTVKVNFALNNDNDAAAKAARSSDVAIVIVGNHPECDAGWAQCPLPSDGKEAVDRKSITLEQEELVKQVYAANPRTVMVLLASFPYAINWSEEHIPAILQLTHNSEEEGNALADVLFGKVNPGGHLVHTWPRSLAQLPPMMDYDIRHGRTYMYFQGQPLYPFGFGLSYSTFAYSNLQVDSAAAGTINVRVDVENTSKRAGDEVVQVYASYEKSKVEHPRLQLVAFRRVTIASQQKLQMELPVSTATFAYWDAAAHRFLVEPGTVKLMVGSSSTDLQLSAAIAIAQ
jgi:beta-glucosidase